MPTLPFLGASASRITRPSRTRDGCAAVKPSSISSTNLSGAFMIFFIKPSPVLSGPAAL